MRLLLTRPEEDAAAIAAALVKRGHRVLSAPLMTVAFEAGPDLDVRGYSAVLATSANGVRALARRTRERDIPIATVGPQTAAAARTAGFVRLFCADGNAADLARALPDFIAQPARLLHVCGPAAKPIAAPGYTIDRFVLYRIEDAPSLPTAAADALRTKALDGALFFSPHSATLFAACVAKAGLVDFCASLGAYCISAAAAKSLAPLPFAQFCIAPHPNRDAMLDMLP